MRSSHVSGLESAVEVTNHADAIVFRKMQKFPRLGTTIDGMWTFGLSSELHMTKDRGMFQTNAATGTIPVYEGKMIRQFVSPVMSPRYWVNKQAAKDRLMRARQRRYAESARAIGVPTQKTAKLSVDTEHYVLAIRSIAGYTAARTLIVTVIPPGVVAGNSILTHRPTVDKFLEGLHHEEIALRAKSLLYVTAVLNSFVIDWMIRPEVRINVKMFYVYELPIPRLTESDPKIIRIATRAAKLLCTTPEFDALALDAGIGSHEKGVMDPEKRAILQAELDGLVAHLYGLTEDEFARVLRTFPIVSEPVRVAAQNAFRAVSRGDIS